MSITTMKTRSLSLIFSLAVTQFSLCAFVLISTAACQKKCQQNTQRFKSVTETQWRLVETTDPAVVEELDNFNFLIVSFATNSTGAVQRVVDNEMFETPISTIVWVPNTKAKQIRIQYTSVPAEETTAQVTEGDLGTFDYSYSLGKELEMTDNTGSYYRYVPFTGIVSPDIDCQF